MSQASRTADVIIVGAGIAGCSVAWHLAGESSVLVLEQGQCAGAEATAQTAGMVRNMVDDPVERVLVRRTLAFFQDPGEDFLRAPSRKSGAVISLARDPYALHDCVAHLRANGVRVEACDRPWEVAPMMAKGLPMTSWYLPDEHLADGQVLVDGFVRGATCRGAKFRYGTRVLELLRDGDRICGVRTDDGDFWAEKVLLAAGAWSEQLLVGHSLRRPLIPLERSVFRTGPHAGATADHPWCWVDDVGIYIRPHKGAWMVCPCDEKPVHVKPGPGSRMATTAWHQQLMASKVERYFPALMGEDVVDSWMGLRTFAPDRRPILGEDPELDGLWWLAGIGGYGISCSYAVGEVLAAWLTGRETPWFGTHLVAPNRPHFARWWIVPDGDVLGARRLDL